MEGFTIVDGGVGFVLLISALLAYSRGFVREIMSIVGWVVAAVVAFLFAGDAEPFIREIPILNQIIGTNCELSIIAAFGLVFVATLIIVSIFTPLISGAVQNSALGPVDQGLGFLFGLARGVLLVVVALIVYDRLIAGGEGVPMVEDSKSVEVLAQTQERISASLPENAPAWIAERYEQLTGSCGPTTTQPETGESTLPQTGN